MEKGDSDTNYERSFVKDVLKEVVRDVHAIADSLNIMRNWTTHTPPTGHNVAEH